jgi:alkylation response protein AidB-like acyl-CoA dehydrogenase
MIAFARRRGTPGAPGSRGPPARPIRPYPGTPLMYEPSPKVQELQARLSVFMDKHIYPNEARHFQEAESLGPWKVHPVVEELKPLARKEGLWNLFLPIRSTAPD